MPKTLSAALILEKNKLVSTNPWLVLIDIYLTEGVTVSLVRNTENITFNSVVYTAFPFTLDSLKETSLGSIPTIQLSCSNVTRVLQTYMEQYGGGVGKTVRITVVNAANLSPASAYADLELDFEVISSTADENMIALTLGATNPLKNRFPLNRFLASHCNWKFDAPDGLTTDAYECQYRTLMPVASAWQANHMYQLGERVYKTGSSTVTFRCYGFLDPAALYGLSDDTTEPTWIELPDSTTHDCQVLWAYDRSCKKTLANCQKLNNSVRYGGFPGIITGGLRLVN